MFLKCLATIVFDNSISSGLSEGQKEVLSSIWNAIKSNIDDHTKFILAKFNGDNLECVGHFYDFGNDAVVNFIEDVLHAMGSTVEYGLRRPEMFVQAPSNMSRQGFSELNKILSNHLLEQVGSLKTDSLVEALKTFSARIESKFEDLSEMNFE